MIQPGSVMNLVDHNRPNLIGRMSATKAKKVDFVRGKMFE